jgi:prepilin-type N-terminal cleavage/methylation domain-containing protein
VLTRVLVVRREVLGAARGFTLAEVVVALGVGGVVFGAFALVLARQERAHADLTRRLRAHAQMQEGAAALLSDLRGLSPAAGDIPPGGARDSAIEFRATIGSAIACGFRGRDLVVAFASFVAPPAPGDTAWAYRTDTTPPTWVSLPLTGARVAAPEVVTCPLLAAAADASSAGRARPRTAYSFELSELPEQAGFAALAPVRVTRPVRYSLYRAPDAAWYLGRREWSIARGGFASVQPVSGPYRAYSPPGTGFSGLELRYFDTDQREVPSGATETGRIARAVISLRAPPARDRPNHPERDVSTVVVAFRNRP